MTQPEPEPELGGPPQPSWPSPSGHQPYPPPYPPHYPPPQPMPVYSVPSPVLQPPTSATGPASFAFGLLATLLGWIPFVGVVAIVLAAAGLAFGMRALRLAKLGYLSDRGLAIGGIVLSCLGLVLGVLFTGFVLVAMMAT